MSSTFSIGPSWQRAARAGLWLLPLYGVLLGVSTLTHQPSIEDFDAYAGYITTDSFLISHLGASIFGVALAVLGAVALTAFLVHGRTARIAITGLALTTVANTFLAATFGSATFVQPGIGRAHLAGVPGMADLNDDTAYGPAFFATALPATLLFVVAAVALGTAVARSAPGLRWFGVGYAALLAAFAVTGFAAQPLQPVAGFGFAVATAALAVRLPSRVPPAPTATRSAFAPTGS